MRKCQMDGKNKFLIEHLSITLLDLMLDLMKVTVLRQLRGSPAYWEHAKKDVFAMIRQLGVPTWFCSLSAAETRWLSLLKVLAKQVKDVDYTDEEIENLTWKIWLETIKRNVIFVERNTDQTI